MRKRFRAYYEPSEQALETLWRSATITLDANVLLNLYRYPTAAREDLLRVLQQLSQRLFVPYQAAIEYQRNRLNVISLQRKRFDEVRNVLLETQNKLQSDLGKLQLEKRHSSINASKLLLGIKSVFDEFTAELNESEKDHLNVRSHDNIRDSIDQIAESRVGDPPSQNELDEIYKEGKSRYENQIPPGYSDTRKAKEVPAQFSTHGLRIERQFGDLILWKQLIKLASTQSLKHLILVTDDEKEDWWLTIDSLGKKTIGPRPELLEEMMDNTSLEDFYIYNSETFLQNAKKYLLAEVKEQSIDEVRMVRQEQNAKSKWESFTRPAVDAAYLWLKGRHPGLAAKVNDAEWEISFEDSTGIVAAYQIYCLSGADSVSQVDFIFDSIRGASSTPSILALRQFGSVIVLEDRNHYGYLEPWIRDVILQSNMSLTIGELHRASDGAASFSPFWSKRVEAR